MNFSRRWQKVKDILYAALEMGVAERTAFLDEKCDGDHELRREVESLLAAHGAAERLESPAIEMIAADVSDEATNGIAGKLLGHYEVIEKLGAGGMGEIYSARDTLLGRKVALKLLPFYFTQDTERVRRFQQEARAASALNHPNILTIYEIRQVDSTHYIATELINGETLRDRISRGPLKITEALDVGIQVAGALAAAHEAGIAHRDIKPENIMLRRDRIVKVLDFGLAKLTEKPATDAEASTMVHTDEGIVMGTAQYMSPEQARGLSVDARTDIWSLGCVLYEMLTGRAAFAAPTTGDVIVSILEREPPPLNRYAENVPAELDWLIKKTLRKDSDERYQTTRELLSDLRSIRQRLEFESELERSVSPENDTTIAARRSGEQVVEGTAEQPISHPTSSAEYIVTGMRNHKGWTGLVMAAILTVAGVVLFYNWSRGEVLTDKDTILLTDFVNTTGDSDFDGTLKQALAVQLGQSPFLNIFPDQRVRESLRYMERSPDERVTKEIGREICQREGLKALLTGSIASLGNNYVITLEALNGQSGDTLVSEQVEAASKEQVLGKLGEAATRLRGKLGESLSSIQKFDAPIQQATTSSLEAFKAYVIGQELSRIGKFAEAIPHLKRAIELDPNFAMAYTAAAVMYSNLADSAATEYATKGFELRDRVTERERLRISEFYYSIVTDEQEKQLEVLELSNRTYPRSAATLNNLVLAYALRGQYEKGVEKATEALRVDPNLAVVYGNLGWNYMALGRYEEAKATFEQAYARNLHWLRIHSNHYLVAFGQGDEAEMQRQLEWASGKPFEYVFLEMKGWGEMAKGRSRQSAETMRRSAEYAQNQGLKSEAGRIHSILASWHALLGDCRQSRAETAASLAAVKAIDPETTAALAPALCGDSEHAQTLLNNLERRWPLSTQVNAMWGPLSRAVVETNKGNGTEAVRLLQKVSSYDMGWSVGYWATYIRAQAHLRQGNSSVAMAEFQKIIDRPGVWPAAVHVPLAHLGLARAAALAGDTSKSRKAYQDFFALWKDADPDIPILVEAKKEYQKLAE
jgi:serine/threonine protein kinase/tetratricopeptide (TPR) repeat protein